MAPGPFTSAATAAIAVLGLFSAPLVWDKIPTAPPTELASAAKEFDSRKLKDAATKEAVASSAWGTATPQAAPEEVTTPTTTAAPAKTPAPTPAPETKKAASKEQAPSSQKAEAKSPFEEIAEKVRPYVHMAEEKVIAFDIMCSGPQLRAASGVDSLLEKWGINLAAVSAAKSVGMSSIAATATISLALIADFGLLVLFLLWRLSKMFVGSKGDARDKRVEAMQKKVAEAQGKTSNGSKGKKGAKTPPTSTGSNGKKNGNGRKST